MIANIVTAANLSCGVASIVFSLQEGYQAAAWLIVLAALLDAFDGKLARYFGSTSPFGIQFDSMADMVSFGVAPAILAYSSTFSNWMPIGVMACIMPVLFVAVRLARFNVSADGKAHDFSGLSAPLHACIVATFVIMSYALWGGADPVVFCLLIASTCILMVTPLPMPGLPQLSWRGTSMNQTKLLLLIAFLLVAVVNPPVFAFPVVVVVVLAGFGVGIFQWIIGRQDQAEELDKSGDPVTMFRGPS